MQQASDKAERLKVKKLPSYKTRTQINTFKIIHYGDFPIYLCQCGEMFWYMTVIGGEIYLAAIRVKVGLWRRIIGKDYQQEEVQGAVQLLVSMAETTIETILNPGITDDTDGNETQDGKGGEDGVGQEGGAV